MPGLFAFSGNQLLHRRDAEPQSFRKSSASLCLFLGGSAVQVASLVPLHCVAERTVASTGTNPDQFRDLA